MATEHEQYQPKLEPAEQRKAVEEEKLSAAATHLATAVLHHHLPEAPWRPMAAALGYSVGFLVVILGSQQLYTENTLTPIVPLMAEPTGRMLRKVLRLWGAECTRRADPQSVASSRCATGALTLSAPQSASRRGRRAERRIARAPRRSPGDVAP